MCLKLDSTRTGLRIITIQFTVRKENFVHSYGQNSQKARDFSFRSDPGTRGVRFKCCYFLSFWSGQG